MKRKLSISLLVLFLCINLFGQMATEIAKTGIRSTVSIVALDNYKQPLSYGSGFIISNGLIATNVHVIEGCKSAYVLMNNNIKKFNVTSYVAIDKGNDLVILKVDGLIGVSLMFANDKLPEIGERIYAIGNPKGLSGTFSEGIVSGKREIENNEVIQITAPISPGSSGGPVLNSISQIVGIAFASYSAGQNLNFAIPVKYLKKLKTSIGQPQPLSNIHPKAKTTSNKLITPNIKEGVIVRNIHMINNKWIEFSIKNNLGYTVSNIRVLFLVYDRSGVIVDYSEDTYFKYSKYNRDNGIKPYLAKSVDFFSDPAEVNASSGSSVKARVLDFKIIEE